MVQPAVVRRAAALLCLIAGGCGSQGTKPAPLQPYMVSAIYPHDRAAFTEGLFFHDGALYESTGYRGRSTLRRVRIADGRVLRRVPFPDGVFGEGIARWKDGIIGLSWREGRAYRWDIGGFGRRGGFSYPGEGWGLTHDGRSLILSDGTAWLRFLDPATGREIRRLRVSENGRPVPRLNELEWVDGCILANVWGSTRIARIDPVTGKVGHWIELAPLAARSGAAGRESVANGIAFDGKSRRLFVTGKNWGSLFVLRLAPISGEARC